MERDECALRPFHTTVSVSSRESVSRPRTSYNASPNTGWQRRLSRPVRSGRPGHPSRSQAQPAVAQSTAHPHAAVRTSRGEADARVPSPSAPARYPRTTCAPADASIPPTRATPAPYACGGTPGTPRCPRSSGVRSARSGCRKTLPSARKCFARARSLRRRSP